MGCTAAKTNDIVVAAGEGKEEPDRPFHERYILQQIIGEGAFARVFLAQNVQYKVDCAVKILDLRDESQKEGNAMEAPPQLGVSPKVEKLIREFNHERRIWKIIGDHPNTVRLYDSAMDNCFGYLVTELCSGTLLQSFRNEPELNEYVLARYFKDMLLGLQHLHSVSVVHRDVKQDNFLMGGPNGTSVKMCDFGLSVLVPASGGLSGVYGTAPYMPPEMLQPKGQHGFGVDVWSLGVMAYSQLFGTFPYSPEKKNAAAMKEVIRRGDVQPAFAHKRQKPGEEHVSSNALAFVKSLLIRDPAERPSAESALTYEYITRHKELEVAARAKGGPLVSLVPMLHGAVRAGAFATRPPQEKPDLDKALADLQCKSGTSNRGAFSKSLGSSSDKGGPDRGCRKGSTASNAASDSTKSGGTTIPSDKTQE
jgi:serine/threonine protein kinase